jgi:hypothetical protein
MPSTTAIVLTCLAATAMALHPQSTAGLKPLRNLLCRTSKICANWANSNQGNQRGYDNGDQNGYQQADFQQGHYPQGQQGGYQQDNYGYNQRDNQYSDYGRGVNDYYQEGNHQQYQQGWRDQYGRDQHGSLDFDQYCQYMREQYGDVSEAELRRSYDEVNEFGMSFDGNMVGYGGVEEELSYAERLHRSKMGSRYKYSGLTEFLRWQDWYIQFCKERKIGYYSSKYDRKEGVGEWVRQLQRHVR